jgi:DTW domain-containing protein YfiP
LNLQNFLEQRQKLQAEAPKFRELCYECIQPIFSCYCQYIQKFDSKIEFIILIHPIEMKRRIATGRMSYLTLENSQLIMGQDYTHNTQLNQILSDPQRHCVMLYPGTHSKNLSNMSCSEKSSLVPSEKKLTVLVIDGTWNTARKTVHLSKNLKVLPRISFSTQRVSQFRVRKQPHSFCFSTIEAIHYTIELLGETQGFDIATRTHDRLLYVFDKMVEMQLHFIKTSEDKHGPNRYRRDKKREISS